MDADARVVAGADAVIVVQHVRGHGLNFPALNDTATVVAATVVAREGQRWD